MEYPVKGFSFIPIICVVYSTTIFSAPYLVVKMFRWFSGDKAGTVSKGYAILSVVIALAVTSILTYSVIHYVSMVIPERGMVIYYVCQYASWVAVVFIALIAVTVYAGNGMLCDTVRSIYGVVVFSAMCVWTASLVILTVKNYIVK